MPSQLKPTCAGPFVRIAPNEISIAHFEGPKKLLLTPQRKGEWYRALRFPDWRFRTPMALLDPAEKTELSRLVSPAYATSAVLKAEEAMSATVGGLLDWMDGYALRGEEMDLARFLTYTAFDVVGAFGIEFLCLTSAVCDQSSETQADPTLNP